MTALDSKRPKDLARLKVSVRHILGVWPSILQRRHYLRSMSQSEALRSALTRTYAAHVHNTLHAVLSSDLIRAIGSLILDTHEDTASVAQVVKALRDAKILHQLRVEYEAPASTPDSNDAAGVQRRTEIDDHFATIAAQLDEIETKLLRTDLARTIRTVRHKVIAHNDVMHDGANWRMWQVEGTGLTYAQLDEYIDACTRVVDTLAHLVLRHAFTFDDLPRVSQRYVDEFIEALILGLSQQKDAKEKRRLENLSRTRELFSDPHKE